MRKSNNILSLHIAHRLLLLLAIVGLATLMSVTTTTSSAQGARVQVTDVKPVQVIEDVPLVAGKATAVKVNVTTSVRTQATIEVRLGASVKSRVVTLARGANTIYIPVDPPGNPGIIEVTARAVRPAGNQVVKQAEVVSLQRNSMRVVFLPVDWTAQDRARNFPAQFNSFVTASSDFFKASYPLPAQNIQIGSSQATHMLTPDQRAIVDAQGNFNWPAITDMYDSIAAAGRRAMPDADLVVGVLPPKWYAHNLNDPAVVGLELHAVQSIVSSQVNAGSSTLAHEVGHVFGLFDDYNFDVNPPKIGTRINVPGYWIAKSLQIGTGGKPVYYSFMGAEDAASRYWVDRDSYLAILQMLQSGTMPRDSLLLVLTTGIKEERYKDMDLIYSVLAQTLPPIQQRSSFDLVNFLVNAVAALLWSVIASLIFSIIVVIAMRIFTLLTPGINELDELKNGNIAVALVMMSFILAVAAVVVAVLIK